MKTMRLSIRNLWVAALRGEEYTQTSNKLRTTEGWCCLGVLCDLYLKSEGGGWHKEHGGHNEVDFYSLGKEDGGPPNMVYDWAGIEATTDSSRPGVPQIIPELIPNGQSGSMTMTELNDDGVVREGDDEITPLTFDEIADLIEEQL